jgi:hypothetical protein
MRPALLRVFFVCDISSEAPNSWSGTSARRSREATVRRSATKKLDSKGGQAAWAANELAADYGAGLALQGSVSITPPTDMTNYLSGV